MDCASIILLIIRCGKLPNYILAKMGVFLLDCHLGLVITLGFDWEQSGSRAQEVNGSLEILESSQVRLGAGLGRLSGADREL